MRHYCSWQNWCIPERMMSTEDTPLGACFLLGKSGLWSKKCPCLSHWQNKYPEMDKQDCQILPRHDKLVLENFLPLKMFCKLLYALAKVGCFNIAHETLGDCQGSQLSLLFIAHFGSCLIALPVYSSNSISLISLFGSSMGLKTR